MYKKIHRKTYSGRCDAINNCSLHVWHSLLLITHIRLKYNTHKLAYVTIYHELIYMYTCTRTHYTHTVYMYKIGSHSYKNVHIATVYHATSVCLHRLYRSLYASTH